MPRLTACWENVHIFNWNEQLQCNRLLPVQFFVSKSRLPNTLYKVVHKVFIILPDFCKPFTIISLKPFNTVFSDCKAVNVRLVHCSDLVALCLYSTEAGLDVVLSDSGEMVFLRLAGRRSFRYRTEDEN